MKWDRITIDIPGKGIKEAIAPVIISASRATDIPGYFGDWFMERFQAGYLEWKNRYNGRISLVSFEKTRLVVFWTKDPSPFLPHLDAIDRSGIRYYFQYTLNNYEKEGIEPGLRKLDDRIAAFIRLSDRIGKDKVIWRYDPVVFTDRLKVPDITDRIRRIADRIGPYTEKLVISFCDIRGYPHVGASLKKSGIRVHEALPEEIRILCGFLHELSTRTGLGVGACAEPGDLNIYGIPPNKCIDDELIRKLFPEDKPLMDFLNKGGDRKDPGQRRLCRCIMSKDIGAYSTCRAGCAYCYAQRAGDMP